MTPGVETTTGPLGQGFGNAVGMAMAEKLLAQHFNRPGHEIVDHHTWAFLGDGCLMEGVSHEAASLAGLWGLNKLVCLYDDNDISIDGHVTGWFRDDTAGRFRAYDWHVIESVDGHDVEAVEAAINSAKTADKPVMIICKTTIGEGSPNKAGGHDVHGAPLGSDEIAACRESLGWPHAPFEIPTEIKAAWDTTEAGKANESDWNNRFAAYKQEHPELALEFERRMSGELPASWAKTRDALLKQMAGQDSPVATRKASQQCLDILVEALPEMLGGSADLTGSNLTQGKTSRAWHDHADNTAPEATPNYISYGVREFGMVAIMNGAALHGGFTPYGGTFAMFSDYSRSGIRMSALMRQRVVHVLTHDSIGLGEDGPTHQPIEHAPSLRIIPNLDLWRPADALETAVAWTTAVERTDGPSVLMLSRQNLPPAGAGKASAQDIARGGYVLSEADGDARPAAIIIATGSEVSLALEAQQQLADEGVAARVVSMPCTNIFDTQDQEWRDSVLPPGVPRLAVEAAHPDYWRKYVGLEGEALGIPSFGESAPASVLYEHFGLTAGNIAVRLKSLAA